MQVISREGDCGTVATWTELTTLGSSGTLPRPVIKKGHTRIRDLIVAWGDGATVLTACGGGRFLRFGGATRDGEQVIGIGGWAKLNTGNYGFGQTAPAVMYKDINIAVKEGEELVVEGAATGTDSGTPTLGYSAILDSGSAPVRQFITREASCTGLDTDTAANIIPGSATTGTVTTPFSGKIVRLIGGYANILPLLTAAGGTAFVTLRNEGGFEGPDIFLPVGGMSSLGTTTGTAGGYFFPIDIPFNRVCRQGGVINVRAQQVGVDHGSPRPWVTVVFEKG